MLEAVVRLRPDALDEQDVGLGEPVERRLESSLVEASVAGLAEAGRAAVRALSRELN